MNGRGLGSSLAVPPRLMTRGSSLRPRLEGLESAVAAARGRLDDELLDSVEASVTRSTGRLRLSSDHTVVAIAGSTGSGKSTLFNALAGAKLSASGAQRPTTSKAKALVWSDDDLGEMLEWLGVPATEQHPRASLSAAQPRTRLPEGLVLLDLPDHDSIEVAHHEEAQRIIELADLLIWVVDPQKYADAAIHERFLQPLAGHRAVTMVVLNHIDKVPEERRAGMVRDLRKLLVADGMRDPRILATSARHGTGMKELRTAIRRRVEEKQNSALRVEADIRAAAVRLEQASGDAPTSVPEVWVTDLERQVAAAAGVTGLVASLRRTTRAEALSRTTLAGFRGEEPTAAPPRRVGPVDRPAVDTAVRNLVDNVCRDLTPAWKDPIRAVASVGQKSADDRLDSELAAVRFQDRLPGWLPLVGVLRVVVTLAAVAALLLVTTAFVRGASTTVPLIALGSLALAGVAVARGSAAVADRVAEVHARAAEDACHRVISRVVRGQMVASVASELAPYARFHRGITAAKR